MTPFFLRDLPSRVGRKLLVAELRLNGQRFHVGTVHLESAQGMASARAEQLGLVTPILRESEHAVLMGDFHFCSSSPEENDNIPFDFHDRWPILRPDEPGYTHDTESNLMLLADRGVRKQVRFDRMVLRTTPAGWQPESIRRLGTEPISPYRREVFPSDHFGVTATLRFAGEPCSARAAPAR